MKEVIDIKLFEPYSRMLNDAWIVIPVKKGKTAGEHVCISIMISYRGNHEPDGEYQFKYQGFDATIDFPVPLPDRLFIRPIALDEELWKNIVKSLFELSLKGKYGMGTE